MKVVNDVSRDLNLLTLVDVGGAGGIGAEWLDVAGLVRPIIFEPNPEELSRLLGVVQADYPSAIIINSALADAAGQRDLYVTRYWGCTSLRTPNFELLNNYRISPAFEVVSTTAVSCCRYDELFRSGSVPQPDAIKIDVQGFEYETLIGFGNLLNDCLVIKVETHVYELYRGQRLLHDLISLLSTFGLVLRRLTPVDNFDGDVVEFDAWFTKRRASWLTLNPVARQKFDLICNKWNLLNYSRVKAEDRHDQYEPE